MIPNHVYQAQAERDFNRAVAMQINEYIADTSMIHEALVEMSEDDLKKLQEAFLRFSDEDAGEVIVDVTYRYFRKLAERKFG